MHTFKAFNIYQAVFSPTGGTARAAAALSDQLAQTIAVQQLQEVDLTLPSARRITHRFSDSDLVIAAAPVYAGQLPPVEGLFENLHGNRTPCIVLAGYGNRHYDDALAQLKAIMTRQGFVVVGAIACIIPHIFSDKLGAGRPDAQDLQQIADFVSALSPRLSSDCCQEAAVPGNPSPEPKEIRPVEKTFDPERCTGCRLCSASCPTDAIDPDTNEIDLAKCISCMRCTRICPGEARTFAAEQTRAWLEENFSEPRSIEFFL